MLLGPLQDQVAELGLDGARRVDDHRSGILVGAGDVAGLAAAIGEVVEDAELRRRCGSAALETARAYTVSEVGRRRDDLPAALPASTVLDPCSTFRARSSSC